MARAKAKSRAAARRTVAKKPEPPSAAGPALALLEIAEVPVGLRALDALVKEAFVEIAARGTVQCGRYLIAFAGQVEPVEMSFGRALEIAGGKLCDSVLLPDAEPRLLPAFRNGVVRWPAPGDALGVVQSETCPTLLNAIDLALKGAQVDLVELRLADGLGGKALATLWGDVHDVEAAIEIAEAANARQLSFSPGVRDALNTVVIPNADDEVRNAVSGGTRFFTEWRG